MSIPISNNPSCTVVIVNWNAGDVIEACVSSIRAQDYSPRPEVVVVDNASNDESLAIIESIRPPVTLIASGENLGFAKGNNLGFESVASELVFFLNPDTILEGRDCLSTLVLDLRPGVGIVGPMLLNPDGSVQESVGAFRTVGNELLMGFGIHRILSDRLRARFAPSFWSQTWSKDVDWLKGAALLMGSETFEKLGRFGEENFMYADDIGICLAAHRAGYRVRYTVDTEVTHLDDHSSSKRWGDAEKQAIVASAEATFLKSNYSAVEARAIIGVRSMFIAIRIAILSLSGPRGRARAKTYKGILRGLLRGQRA